MKLLDSILGNSEEEEDDEDFNTEEEMYLEECSHPERTRQVYKHKLETVKELGKAKPLKFRVLDSCMPVDVMLTALNRVEMIQEMEPNSSSTGARP